VVRRIPPRWALFGFAVLGLLAVSLWLRAGVPDGADPVIATVRRSSIAVLPFLNTNPDSLDDYLGTGVAAELTRGLDRLPGLRVAPRSSVMAHQLRDQDPRSVGRALGVSTVLEGSIRRAGDRLRVTAHLVDVAEGFDLWSDTYERSPADLPDIQREIRLGVAGAFRMPIEADTAWLRGRTPANFGAYEAYLAGTHLLEEPGPDAARQAVAHLNRAVRLDSGFAPAYAALAEAYIPSGAREALPPRIVMPKAEAAALKALELDTSLAEAHVALGMIRFGYQRNWRAAEAEFRRALALQPRSTEAYQAYARFLVAMGRRSESVQASEQALNLSPAAPQLLEHLGWTYLYTRQYDQARETLVRAIELDSTNWRAHLDLALLEQTLGNHGEALNVLRLPLSIAPDRPEVQVALGQAYALSGNAAEARAILHRLQDAAKQDYIPSYLLGCLQAALGLRVQAFASFDRALRERSGLVVYVRVDPRLDVLRTDRRFARLLRQVRLP
jgi:TolB-like protein/Tfp pilus assembly protein PilF